MQFYIHIFSVDPRDRFRRTGCGEGEDEAMWDVSDVEVFCPVGGAMDVAKRGGLDRAAISGR